MHCIANMYTAVEIAQAGFRPARTSQFTYTLQKYILGLFSFCPGRSRAMSCEYAYQAYWLFRKTSAARYMWWQPVICFSKAIEPGNWIGVAYTSFPSRMKQQIVFDSSLTEKCSSPMQKSTCRWHGQNLEDAPIVSENKFPAERRVSRVVSHRKSAPRHYAFFTNANASLKKLAGMFYALLYDRRKLKRQIRVISLSNRIVRLFILTGLCETARLQLRACSGVS